jgi:hypothetical protein
MRASRRRRQPQTAMPTNANASDSGSGTALVIHVEANREPAKIAANRTRADVMVFIEYSKGQASKKAACGQYSVRS